MRKDPIETYPKKNPVCIRCRNYMPDIPPDGYGLGELEECSEGLDMRYIETEEDCESFESEFN